jgi:hypothetical protein
MLDIWEVLVDRNGYAHFESQLFNHFCRTNAHHRTGIPEFGVNSPSDWSASRIPANLGGLASRRATIEALLFQIPVPQRRPQRQSSAF